MFGAASRLLPDGGYQHPNGHRHLAITGSHDCKGSAFEKGKARTLVGFFAWRSVSSRSRVVDFSGS
jgi:hypothetical protein